MSARSKAVFSAGGIVALDAEIPEHAIADHVDARAYPHPALGDRKVVRLAAHALAPGVDLEMKTLGFGDAEDRGTMGKQKRRALGFPGWALVHDPEHARYALEVVGALGKEARRARSKPGHAKKGIDTIAETLGRSVPHFLPSFFEEAGRIFMNEGNLGFAAQMFESAREAERVHGLSIDEELRRDAFLEFALAGAVSIKSLTTYAKDLEQARSPEDAYRHFRQLALQRTLGGMPPWASMARDLRRLAKAAKLDVAAEDEAFIGELIGSPALKRAAREMWSAYAKPLVRIAQARPEVRGTLLDLFPQPSGSSEGFFDEWLALLDACGALDALRETDGLTPEAARPREGAAAWLTSWVKHITAGWRAPAVSKATFALLESMAARLAKDGVPVTFATQWGRTIDVDLLELALTLGVPVSELEPSHIFELATWAKHASDPGHGRDPVHVAADPRFRTALIDAVGRAAGDPTFEKAAHGMKGLADIRRDWLRTLVERVSVGGLLQSELTIAELAQKTSKTTFAEFPDVYAILKSASVWRALGRTLRNGIIDELGWPALDDALARHWPDEKVTPAAMGTFPYVCLTDGSKVVVVGPEREELTCDLRLPKSAELQTVRYVQGELLVVFRQTSLGWNLRGYWSRDPNDVFDISFAHGLFGRCDRGVLFADGSISTGGKALSAGDRGITGDGHMALLCDGTTLWQPEWTAQGQKLREIDPRTGDKARLSMPVWIEEFAHDGCVLALAECRLAPLPSGITTSPLGAKNGLTGWRVRQRAWNDPRAASRPTRESEGIDGRRFEGFLLGHLAPSALVTLPGDEHPRPVSAPAHYYDQNVTVIWDVEGRWQSSKAGSYTPYSAGSRVPLEVGFWHLYRPRDPQGSRALRAIDECAVEALREAATADHVLGAEQTKRTEETIRELLPSVTSRALARALTKIVQHAASLEASLASFREANDPSGARRVDAALPTDAELGAALGAFHHRAGYGAGTSCAEIQELDAQLRRTGADAHVSKASQGERWERFVGAAGLFAFLASRFATAEASRTHLASLLSFWADTALARPPGALRYVRAKVLDDVSPVPAWITGLRSFTAQLATIDGHGYWMRGVDRWGGTGGIDLIEHAPAEPFRLPAGLEELESYRVEERVSPEWAAHFAELLAARGPVAYEARMGEELARRTGLPTAAAALLLAGLPGLHEYKKNFLTKEVRVALDLKVDEADAARKQLRAFSLDEVTRVIASAMPDDPAVLWEPLEGGESSFIARLARAWNERFGEKRATSVDDALLATVEKELALGAALALFADPDHDELTNDPTATELDAWGRFEHEHTVFSESTLVNVVTLSAWLTAFRPVGDPLRSAIPKVIERARARARHPELLVSLGATYVYGPERKAELYEQVGGEPLEDGRDAGLILVRGYDYGVRADLRPSRVESEEDWRRAEQVLAIVTGNVESARWQAAMHRGLAAVRALFSPDFDALVARVLETPVPAGALELDPRKSAPEVVLNVRTKHDLDEDAATLYLQTLALLAPKRADVLVWNDWTAARYKKAAGALVARELLVDAKRARAGREIFLPGGWEALKAPHPPFESWKAPLYGAVRDVEGRLYPPLGAYIPCEPVHALFARAWARVEGGDAPRYEEVR